MGAFCKVIDAVLFIYFALMAIIAPLLDGQMSSRRYAVLGEMIGSGKATERLLMIYVPFMGIGILALLRGLLSQNSGAVGKRPVVLARRKRA